MLCELCGVDIGTSTMLLCDGCEREYDRNRVEYDYGQQACQTIVSHLNQMGNGKTIFMKGFLDEVLRAHPTLQQSFMREVVLRVMKVFAEIAENKWYDLRNEESCKLAERFCEQFGDAYLPFI